MPPLTSGNTRRAFTLVELLTVIAIISILAAILIPTVAKSRAQARSVQCQSNLRQNYIAINLYIQDNKDRLPGPLLGIQSSLYSSSIASQLASNLAIYQGLVIDATIRRNPYLLCPAHEALMADKSADERSYAILLDSSTQYPFGNSADGTKPKYMKAYTNDYNPKTMWMLRDIDQVSANQPTNKYLTPEPSHKSGCNYLFFDGSIRLLDKLQQDALAIKVRTNHGW